jgi:hypothetical protein
VGDRVYDNKSGSKDARRELWEGDAKATGAALMDSAIGNIFCPAGKTDV